MVSYAGLLEDFSVCHCVFFIYLHLELFIYMGVFFLSLYTFALLNPVCASVNIILCFLCTLS